MKRLITLLAAFCGLTSFVASPAFAATTTVSTEAELKAAVATGGEITLGADITLDAYVEIPAGVTVTLDLNGYEITVPEVESGVNHIYALNNKGVMTITDTSAKGDGSISARGIYNGYNGSDIEEAVAGAKMTIEGGNFFGLDTTGGAAIFNCAELIIEDGSFDGKTAAVNNRTAGVATINGGTFTGGLVLGSGYVIQNRGEMTINNATVNATFGALGIYGGTTVIENGTFRPTGVDGKTSHVVYIKANATSVTINDGIFEMSPLEGATPDSGAAVLVSGSVPLTINDGSFIGMNGMVSGNANTTINGGAYATIFDYNHYDSLEGYVTVDSTVTVGGKTYTKTEGGLVEVFPAYVVLPEGITVENYETLFGDNTVTDGVNYYATMKDALAGIHLTGKNTLYCKPGADVGTMTHGHVCSSLTVYGNGAKVSGGEQDFEVDTYKFCHSTSATCSGITGDLTLTVVNLNGAGAWGQRTTAHTLNLVFEGCANMGKIVITGTTGTLNITMTDCAFEGVISEAIYSNADGAITLTNVDFSNLNKAVNLNHKAAGTQTITMTGCSFTNCGADVAADQIPVRVLSSEGGKSVLTVENCTFSGTPAGGDDILLDYASSGETVATISGTAATLTVENSTGDAAAQETVTEKIYTATNSGVTEQDPVAQVGTTYYASLTDAFAAAKNGDTITLLEDIETSATFTIGDEDADDVAITLDMNGKKITVTDDKTSNYELFYIYGGLTVTGNGTIELTATNNREWNASSSIFHNRGGVLTIKNGTFTHKGGTDMAFVVDNSANWYGDATTIINGGTLSSTYTAIRNRMEENSHGASGTAYLTVNGGTITGDTSAIWAQAASKSETNPATGVIAITGGTIGVVNTARSTGAECMTTISGGTVEKFKGEVGELTVTGNGTVNEVEIFTAGGEEVDYAVTEEGLYAPAVAKIGETTYATFADALAAANGMTGDVEVEIFGAVEFVDGMELDAGSFTSIAFVGKSGEAKMTINQSAGGDYLTAHGKTVSFTDLTLAKANPAWADNAGHMGNYFSIQGGTVTYTNCVFPNGACANTSTATYNNCTFQNASEYGLWVYDDALVTVNGGTFDSAKGVKVYSEDETSVTSTLTVQNATFTANVTKKPAIAIGYATSVTLIGNTYNNTTGVLELDSGSDADCEGIAFVAQDAEDNDISATITAVDRSNSNAACGVLMDGKIYTTVAEAAAEATSTSTVTLLYASTETVELPAGVTLDKNGYDADGVTVALSFEGEGTAASPYLIPNKEMLVAFRDSVNAGNAYKGKFFKLTADIDLTGETWTPIGTKDAPFKGTFNGTYKESNKTLNRKISNMVVSGADSQGFFGYADNATIVGIELVNPTVTGTDCVGGIAGCVYSESLINNCHVSGTIKIEGQTNVGGITGKYYTKVTNCSVIGDGAATSYVKGVYAASDFEGDNIGGIMGHCGENNVLTGHTVKNITVSGTRKVAAIVGIADQNTDIQNCIVQDVVVETTATVAYADSKVTSMSIGGLIGQYQTAGSSVDGTVTGCTVKNVTFTKPEGVTVDIGPVVGGARGGSTGMLEPSEKIVASANDIHLGTITGSSNTYLMTTVAQIGSTQYYTLEDAANAAQNDDTITLLGDCTHRGTPTIPAGVTLKSNGYAINGSIRMGGDLTLDGELKLNGGLWVGKTEGNLTATLAGDKLTASYFMFQRGTYTIDADIEAVYGYLSFEGAFEVNSTITTTNTNGEPLYLNGNINLNSGAAFNIKYLYLSNANTVLNVKEGATVTASGSVSLTNAGAQLYSVGNISGTITNSVNATIAISGGTYTQDVSAWCVAGYVCAKNADGTFSVAWSPAAKIGDQEFATLQDAVYFAAEATAAESKTIKLTKDMVLTETLTVGKKPAQVMMLAATDSDADDTVVLDLNGKTVSMEDASSKTAYLVKNLGNLTVTDSSTEKTGKLTFMTTTPSTDNSYSTSTIGNAGSLTIESGTIENTTAGGACYAIDTLWYSSDILLTIAGGMVKSERNAIRQVLYSTTAKNVLNVTGGTITGGYAAIQTHNFSTGAKNLGTVKISGGTITGNGGYSYYTSYADNVGHGGTDVAISGGTFTGAVYVYNSKTGASETEFANVAISGGTFDDGVCVYTKDAEGNIVPIGAISGGTFDLDPTAYCAEGYSAEKNADNNTWTVSNDHQAKIGTTYYTTFAAALAAALDGETVTLLTDLTIADPISITKSICLDGNGHTLTYTGTNRAIDFPNNADANIDACIANLTVDCTASYCQRGISFNESNGELYLDTVTVKGTNLTYALNLPGDSDGAKITTWASSFTGNIALNIWGENVVINAINSHFISVDNSAEEDYAAIALNNDGSIAATGTKVNVSGGSVIAYKEDGTTPSVAVRDAVGATLNINVDSGVGGTLVGEILQPVASIKYGDCNYAFYTLKDALETAKAGDTITLLADITEDEIVTIDKAITLDGNGKTLTSTAARAINVATEGNVTIKNLTIVASGERAINVINQPANLTIDKVTATADNYTVNVAKSAGAAQVTITNSDLTGLNVVNVAGAGANVTVTDTELTNNNTDENQAFTVLNLNKDATGGTITANGCTFTLGINTVKGRNDAENGTITIDGTTDGVDVTVAYIDYGDYFAPYPTLAQAIAQAKDGDKVVFIRDITEDEIVTINKAITLDGNGKKLTSTATRAINVSGANGVTIKNLTIEASGERAINIIQNATNVTIDNVTATADNYTINVAISAGAAQVAITNSTLTGACTVNVSGEGADVTIAGSTVDCVDNNTTTGESYAALSLNREAAGGSIIATDTTVNVTDGSDSYKGRNSAENGTVTINGSADDVVVMVAVITYEGNDYYYGFETLAEAIEFAKTGDTITLLRDIASSEFIVIDKAITLDGNGKTLTSTAERAINVATEGNVTIKNLTIECSGERGINVITKPANLTIENCNITANNYAVNVAGSAGAAQVAITGSTLTGLNVVNVAGADADVTIDNSTINCALNTTAEKYAALCLNMAATGATISVDDATEIKVGSTSEVARNGATNGSITINGVESGSAVVAVIEHGNYYNSFATLADAIAAAQNGQTIKLIRDATEANTVTVAGKSITLDLNGKTVSGVCDSDEDSLIYIENGAALTVKDTSTDADGKLTFAQGSSNVGYTVNVKGVLTLESGTIELTGSWSIGFAVDVRPNSWGTEYTNPSVFTMNGGNIVSSDGAVRVASSSAEAHENVSASFVMNGGKIDAVWDGVFIQQSNDVYDVLAFTMNGGTIESDLNPIRVYGPAPTSYVNGQDCMNITLNGGTCTYTGAEQKTDWIIDGILRAGDAVTTDTIIENGNVTVSAEFAQNATLPEGYEWAENSDGTFSLAACAYVAQVGDVEYKTLQEAIDAATAGQTVQLIADVVLTETVTVAADDEIVLDLAGFDITPDNNQINLLINGKLTIKDTVGGGVSTFRNHWVKTGGELVVNGGTVQNIKTATGGFPVNLESGAKATINGGLVEAVNSDNYAVSVKAGAELKVTGGKIEGRFGGINSSGTVTINDGTINVTEDIGGHCVYASAGTVTINDGDFNPYNKDGDATSYSVYVDGANVTINGGAFEMDVYGRALGKGDNGTLTVKGGTFTSTEEYLDSNLKAFLADGYAALKNLDGMYVVGAKPTATVNNLGAMTIPESDYEVYGGSKSGDMPLNFVMQFLADQDAEDMETSPYAEWYGDFVLTFTGLENGSFTADDCYLAGYYGDFGWVKVPVDGMTIENGVRYPVMLGVGLGQAYEYICSGVKDFRCALYLTPEILAANPNLTVKLELSIVDDSKGDDAARDALADTELKFVNVVGETSYDAEDFASYIAQIVTKDENGNDVVTKYASLQTAIDAAGSNPVTILNPDGIPTAEANLVIARTGGRIIEEGQGAANVAKVLGGSFKVENGELVYDYDLGITSILLAPAEAGADYDSKLTLGLKHTEGKTKTNVSDRDLSGRWIVYTVTPVNGKAGDATKFVRELTSLDDDAVLELELTNTQLGGYVGGSRAVKVTFTITNEDPDAGTDPDTGTIGE